MDKIVWNKSEVMNELEKNVVDAMKKNAQDKLTQINKSVVETTKNINNLKSTLKNLSDDDNEPAEDEGNGCSCEVVIMETSEDNNMDLSDVFSISDDEFLSAKASLISELTMKKDSALNDGDIVTVYMIERKIAELEEE